MILTDYLLLESIQHRIGANKIRVRFTTEFFRTRIYRIQRILIEVKILSTDILHFPTAVGTEGLFQDLQKNIWGFGQDFGKKHTNQGRT